MMIAVSLSQILSNFIMSSWRTKLSKVHQISKGAKSMISIDFPLFSVGFSLIGCVFSLIFLDFY